MKNRNYILISKIIGYIDKINDYSTNIDKSDFLNDSKLIEACVFNLLQIGELTSRLNEDFRSNHTEVPWQKIRGLRNRLVHDYEGVNLELVWDIIDNDLNSLCNQLISINDI